MLKLFSSGSGENMFKKIIMSPFILWIGVLLLTLALAQFLYGPFKYDVDQVSMYIYSGTLINGFLLCYIIAYLHKKGN